MQRKYKILLVDDMPEWLNSHSNMLELLFGEDFFEIEYAISAKNAFSKVISNTEAPYDLIIADLEMENIADESYAGAWLVKNLQNKEICKNTGFLIISGSYDIEKVAGELKISYIPKDSILINPLSLEYKVNELLNIVSC